MDRAAGDEVDDLCRKAERLNVIPDTDSQSNPDEAGSELTCRLLKLPAELRTTIYECCLLEHDGVWITPSLKEPPLLWTCKQIREEALKVWYSNDFYVFIYDCDASLLEAFKARAKAAGMYSGLPVRVKLRGREHWPNLMKWCEMIWEGRMSGFGKKYLGEKETRVKAVVTAAHQIARDPDHKSWEGCERALMNLRYVVSKFEPNWAKEWEESS